MKNIGLIICLGVFLFCCGCVKKNQTESEQILGSLFGKIDSKTYAIADLMAFTSMRYYHPVRVMSDRFPGNRITTTLFVETQALFPEAQNYKKQVMDGQEWKWKERYLAGHFYLVDVIDKNMGATDKEIYDYYKKNRTQLEAEYGVAEGDSALDIRARVFIVKTLFLKKYPPSEEFKASLSGFSQDDIETRWFDQISNNREQFFRNEAYKKKYDKDFPKDNVKDELINTDKLITDADVKTVSAWIDRGVNISENVVVAKMASWILFSKEAEKINFVKTEGFKKTKEQFEKFEIVRYFVDEILPNKISNNFTPNKDFVTFAVSDKKRALPSNVSEEEIAAFSDSLISIMYEMSIIEYIHQKRAKANVQFLQSDYVDMFDKTPAQIKQEADSLAINQNIERAKKIYRDLNEWFLYSPEGKFAYLEAAKLQIDAKLYSEAINSYRNFLLYGGESSEWCEAMFMIGNNYEQLEKYPFAALNYRWILKNLPDCSWASHTEFLYLHLGEPTPDIEELRQESIRQGRE